MSDLSKSEQIALLKCVQFRPGFYIGMPAIMARLAKKGLAFKTAGDAYSLTQAGADAVRTLKEVKS